MRRLYNTEWPNQSTFSYNQSAVTQCQPPLVSHDSWVTKPGTSIFANWFKASIRCDKWVWLGFGIWLNCRRWVWFSFLFNGLFLCKLWFRLQSISTVEEKDPLEQIPRKHDKVPLLNWNCFPLHHFSSISFALLNDKVCHPLSCIVWFATSGIFITSCSVSLN